MYDSTIMANFRVDVCKQSRYQSTADIATDSAVFRLIEIDMKYILRKKS